MGTAFSSSLFGLAGSLVLGFLDLQAGRAQNRFYIELENWLSSVTDVGSDVAIAAARPGSSDEIRAMAESLRHMQESGGSSQRVTAAMATLAEGVAGLVKSMRAEQQMMRDWVESQAAEQKAMHATMERVARALEKDRAE